MDTCFDVMSGLTTTGLTLIQDLDHASNGINMWQHLLTFVGSQGTVVLALTSQEGLGKYVAKRHAVAACVYCDPAKKSRASAWAEAHTNACWNRIPNDVGDGGIISKPWADYL